MIAIGKSYNLKWMQCEVIIESNALIINENSRELSIPVLPELGNPNAVYIEHAKLKVTTRICSVMTFKY